MKLFVSTFAALAVFVAAANGLDLVTQTGVSLESQESQVGEVSPYTSPNQADQVEQNDADQEQQNDASRTDEDPNQAEQVQQNDASKADEDPNQAEQVQQNDASKADEDPNQAEQVQQNDASKTDEDPNQAEQVQQNDASKADEDPNQAEQVQQDDSSRTSQDSPNQTDEADDSCTLTGTYVEGTNVTHCSSIVIDSLSVPAGVMLDLTNVTDGASIKFQGTTTFGTKKWEGPLVKLKGNNLSVTGPGTLDGEGSWYWPQGQNITRPVFFRLSKVVNSTLSGFTIKNMPFRTFSILSSNSTTISGLTIDSRAGSGLAKNTDGFDLSRNDGITITGNRIYNQDDCLAMQSSVNTIFSNNYCNGSHGISIGSLGAKEENINSTVSGLLVKNNIIANSANGLRIKTIIGLKGLVNNITYTNNKLVNVKHAIVMHSDYNKTKGGYSGIPSSLVKITNIKIDGLFGTATNLYNIVANPSVVSNWFFTNIAVNATNIGNCTGEPSNVQC